MAKQNNYNGRINKKPVNFAELKEYCKILGQKISIKVGIIGSVAHQKHEDTGLTNAELGAVHEFGATINNPGGQPYIIKDDGMAQFVSKSKGAKLPKTKPHTITIPARAFLRNTLLKGNGIKELKKIVAEHVGFEEAEYLKPETVKQFVFETAEHLGNGAVILVKQAFEDNTITPTTKPASKKQRKYNPQNPTLVDTGQLENSISYSINGKQYGMAKDF